MTTAASATDAAGPRLVARWDLDKTYLRTEFDTIRDLVRTAVERPDRKRSMPGAAALLRELRRSGARVHILSGSPKQMRSRLEEKLAIDRVRYDELTLKPNLSNALRLRFRAMRDQLGYKLPNLLAARARDQHLAERAGALREVLVGDDAEADAFVYSLYADVCSGAVDATILARVLDRGRVYSDQAELALASQRSIEPHPVVERILIHLDRQTPPSRFYEYGARVVPFYNYLQAAMVMWADGHVSAEGVLRVASELVQQHRFDADALSRSYFELVRRGHARKDPVEPLTRALADLGGRLPTLTELTAMVGQLRDSPVEPGPPLPASPLDYVALAEKHRGGRNRRRPGAR
jgi:prepilin-type processing-associated H-X9-DG protein